MIQPKGYDVIRADRLHSKGGGVLLFYKSHLRVEHVELKSCNQYNSNGSSMEFVCIDLFNGVRSCRFLCFYVPPASSSSTASISTLCHILQSLTLDTIPCYIFGDFNLPQINWNLITTDGDLAHQNFLNFCITNCLFQCIDEATHVKGNILDLLFSNTPAKQKMLNYSVRPPLSSTCDHSVISFEIQSVSKNEPAPSYKYPNFSKSNFQQISADLNLFDWDNIITSLSPQSFYDNFVDVLLSLIDIHVPFKSSKKNCNGKQPKHIRVLLKEKLLLYKKFKVDRSLKEQLKLKEKEYEKAVNKWHDDLESNMCVNPSSRKFYDFVNRKLKSHHSIPPMRDSENKIFVTDVEKADLFNTCFQKVFTSDNCCPLNKELKTLTKMDDFLITEKDIISAVLRMKDKISRTPEGIPMYFIKRVIKSIVKPLCFIFNSSLQSNVVPHQWKRAIVIPVYKKGSRNSPKNYRPISLTSSFCRILESILFEKILSHLLSLNLISPRQFGFLPSRSSCSQLLECLFKWSTAVSEELVMNVVYTDISKAFDSVVHSKLIQTLRCYGLNDQLLNWFENYLSGRSQQVSINDCLSNHLDIHSGVPQGSVIGPLLFLIYFNDVTSCCNLSPNKSEVYLFADDTKLFNTDPDSLQKSLDLMDSWLKDHQLKLAYEKCFLMQISKPSRKDSTASSLNFNNNPLSCVPVFKDLGIHISSALKWDYHVNYIHRIASNTSYQILKAFSTKNLWTLRKLFITYVRPKCEYNTPVWSPSQSGDIKKIESIQKSFTRKIFLRSGVKFSSYEDRLNQLNLLSLQDRRTITDLVQMFKIIRGQSDLIFEDFFTYKSNPYTLRGNQLKVDPKTMYNSPQFRSSFFFRGPKYWNSLPNDVANSSSIQVFKSKLFKLNLKSLL